MRATAPVVLVIFDEFPVHSLMGADGRIDKRLYPNFARLAARRDLVPQHRLGRPGHPLRGARDPRRAAAAPGPPAGRGGPSRRTSSACSAAATSCTCARTPRPCARRACAARSPSDDAALGRRRARLRPRAAPGRGRGRAASVSRTRPSEATRATRGWSRARASAIATCGSTPTSPTTARRASRSSCDGIEGGRRPRLHLIHILLPHVPFQYLPSGHFYRRSPKEALPGLDGRPGYGSPFVVEQAYQRHLLQVQATDRLLGELLDRLHEVGIYDRAVVGGGGRPRDELPARPRPAPGAPRERAGHRPGAVLPEGAGPEARPRSATGRCRRSTCCPRSRTCSACEIPWKVDGRSALAPPKPRRREIVAKKFKHTYLVDTPALRARQAGGAGAQGAAVRRGHLRVRAAAGPDRRRRAAPAGARSRWTPRAASSRRTWPGRSRTAQRGGGRTVAVAVNGRVAATGLTFTLDGRPTRSSTRWSCRSGRSRPGRNRIEVLLVEGDELEPV